MKNQGTKGYKGLVAWLVIRSLTYGYQTLQTTKTEPESNKLEQEYIYLCALAKYQVFTE
jgi:hypothetical protein